MGRVVTCDGVTLLLLQASRALTTAEHAAVRLDVGSKRSLRVSLIWPHPDQAIRGRLECNPIRGPVLTGQVVRIFEAPQSRANWEVTARILLTHGRTQISFAAQAIEVRQLYNPQSG